MRVLRQSLGDAFSYIFGSLFLGVIFLGPWIIARIIAEQAYKVTEVAALIAVPIAIIVGLVGIIRATRKVVGVMLFLCFLVVSLFLWVWSLLIVDAIWGLAVLYIANFFLGVGAIAAALLASLLTGHWSVLLQLVVIGIVAFVMQAVAVMFLSEDSASA